jgi:hypothetical protein
MVTNGSKKLEHNEEISELNNIFEDLLGDAQKLAKDLISGINLTFVVGALGIVFGLQTIWSNRVFIFQGDLIPVLLTGVIITASTIVILRGFILRNKYSRLIETYKKIRKY